MIPSHSHDSPTGEESLPTGETVGERLGPTKERLRQAARLGADTVVQRVEDGVSVPRMLDGDVLELLLSRDVIDSEEYDCGQDLHRHWRRSGLVPSGVVDLARERVDGGGADHMNDVTLFHRSKFNSIIARLGAVHSSVLCDCVLVGLPLEVYGLRHCRTNERRKARDRAQALLTAALRQLVINENGGAKRGGVRAHVGERPGIPPAPEKNTP